MFNLKFHTTGQSSVNAGSNNSLPNNYGEIRTLKKDFEDFKSGKNKEDFALPLNSESAISSQKTAQPEASPQPRPVTQAPSIPKKEPVEQKIPQPNIPVKNNFPPAKPVQPKSNPPKNQERHDPSGIPNPFGSDSFYQEQTPFENVGEELNKQAKASLPKSSGKLGTILAITLIFLVAGGGAYYWWFYMRNQTAVTNKTASPATSGTTANLNTNATTQQTGQSANTKFKQWTIDLTSDKIATKLAIKRYINDFITAASENDIIEAKLLSNDGQSIDPVKFEDLFDFQLPASVSGGVNGEYSIFVKKEGGLARMGAAFKLSQISGISESLKSEESSIAKNLMSFYLDAALSDSVQSFNNGKYKSADIRYFNFASPPNTSLDYTVISGQENNYFIFATSKGAMHSILDYMSTQ
jgi:flagellar basal body-associated protein FliL